MHKIWTQAHWLLIIILVLFHSHPIFQTSHQQPHSAPLSSAGGNPKMISISHGSCQPHWEPWTLDYLVHKQSIALGLTINNSTHLTYTSALNSYLTFCKIQNFPIEPAEETFSFFIIYMSTPKPVFVYHRVLATGEVCLEQNKRCNLLDTSS